MISRKSKKRKLRGADEPDCKGGSFFQSQACKFVSACSNFCVLCKGNTSSFYVKRDREWTKLLFQVVKDHVMPLLESHLEEYGLENVMDDLERLGLTKQFENEGLDMLEGATGLDAEDALRQAEKYRKKTTTVTNAGIGLLQEEIDEKLASDDINDLADACPKVSIDWRNKSGSGTLPLKDGAQVLRFLRKGFDEIWKTDDLKRPHMKHIQDWNLKIRQPGKLPFVLHRIFSAAEYCEKFGGIGTIIENNALESAATTVGGFFGKSKTPDSAASLACEFKGPQGSIGQHEVLSTLSDLALGKKSASDLVKNDKDGNSALLKMAKNAAPKNEVTDKMFKLASSDNPLQSAQDMAQDMGKNKLEELGGDKLKAAQAFANDPMKAAQNMAGEKVVAAQALANDPLKAAQSMAGAKSNAAQGVMNGGKNLLDGGASGAMEAVKNLRPDEGLMGSGDGTSSPLAAVNELNPMGGLDALKSS